MVQTWPVPLEESAHRGIRGQRTQQLDVASAHADQYGFHPLLFDCLPVLQGHSQTLREELDGFVQVFNRNADVIDPPKHGPRGYSDGCSASAAAISAGPGSRLATLGALSPL